MLRDDGITYYQYVTELTYLLFLKMAKETKREKGIPKAYRWRELEDKAGVEQLNFYRKMLVELGTVKDSRVQAIFANAGTSLRQPRNLKKLVEDIDAFEQVSLCLFCKHAKIGLKIYEWCIAS